MEEIMLNNFLDPIAKVWGNTSAYYPAENQNSKRALCAGEDEKKGGSKNGKKDKTGYFKIGKGKRCKIHTSVVY
jgi:hypothetical protein